jgi:RNA polymerase sigma factor (sigma-70 family)
MHPNIDRIDLTTMKNAEVFWTNIYNECAGSLLALCRRYVKDLALAEDLMHEGFIKAMTKHQTFDNRGDFRGWLRRIVVNTVLMHLRKRKQIFFVEIDESIPTFSDDENVDFGQRQSADMKAAIEEASFSQLDLLRLLHEIPDQYRIVFNLYVLEGYQHSEIAQLLNISVGTSKSNLSRARNKIAQVLYQRAKEGQDDEKRKIVAASVMLAPMMFVDGLFKDAFAAEQIPPAAMPPSVKHAIGQSNKAGSLSFGASMVKVFIGFTLVAIGVATTLLFRSFPESRQTNSNFVVVDSLGNKPDSISKVSFAEKDSNVTLSNTSNPYTAATTGQQVNRVPLVIKKQVIVRDTIFMRTRK